MNDLGRVEQSRQDDDRGAVLVVVHDRNVQALLQTPFDFEAARCRDVLEVDAAEDRGDVDHGLDDRVDVLGVQADREGVDAGELFEEHALALHHRRGGQRPDVAEPQDRGAVADDRHRVALNG